MAGKPAYRDLACRGSEAEQAAEAAAYARSWHDSLVDDVFGGLLQSSVTCGACGSTFHCFDPFLDMRCRLRACESAAGPHGEHSQPKVPQTNYLR